MYHHAPVPHEDPTLMRRPFGPVGFGFPFLGGFLGGLAAGALARPPYYPPPPPYIPPYPYYGGYWY